MKTVLVLNQFALPRSEGGPTRHADLFERLTGWHSLILAGNRNYHTQQTYTSADTHFDLITVPSSSGSIASRTRTWLKYSINATSRGIRTRDLSLVYASTPHPLAPVAGAIIAKLKRVPLVVEVRDLWPASVVDAGTIRSGGLVHRALAFLERWMYRRANHVVAVTPGWEEHFAKLGVAPSSISVISNGAAAMTVKSAEERVRLRSTFGVSRFTAVYTGSHGRMNALDQLIDAARELPDIDFLLVGDGHEKMRLIARVENEGLPNVRFLDTMPKDSISALLAACDVGVHCIEPLGVLSNGMSPNKLFDYLASGLPIVSNAVTGLRSVLDRDECGKLVESGRLPHALRVVRDASPVTREAWSRRGREIVDARYSTDAAAQRLAGLLDSLTDGTQSAIDRNNRPDVVHISTVHTPTDNRITRKECAALRREGLDVRLIVPADPGLKRVDGVPIVGLPRRTSRLSRSTIGTVDAWRALRALRPPMIHVHDPELIPLALLWSIPKGRRAVYDSHEDLPKQVAGKTYIPAPLRRPAVWLSHGLELAADKFLDGVVAATPAIARNYRNPNTVLVQNFPWRAAYEASACPELPMPPVVGYVGGITPERGCREMIKAVQRSAQSPRLVLAGPVNKEAQKIIDDESRCTEYRGLLPASEIPDLLKELSIGMVLFHPLPNHLESQPTKLFEYMAAGRPFIASNFPAWVQKFEKYDCGLFVDPLDVDAIAAAIDWLTTRSEDALAMGRRGKAAVMAEFVFDSQVEALVKVTAQRRHPDHRCPETVES